MKIFVYKKKDSKKIKVIKHVICVYQTANRLIINTEKRSYAFDTNEVKTTCYQN